MERNSENYPRVYVDYRCRKCGQRIAEDVKICPACKTEFKDMVPASSIREVEPAAEEKVIRIDSRRDDFEPVTGTSVSCSDAPMLDRMRIDRYKNNNRVDRAITFLLIGCGLICIPLVLLVVRKGSARAVLAIACIAGIITLAVTTVRTRKKEKETLKKLLELDEGFDFKKVPTDREAKEVYEAWAGCFNKTRKLIIVGFLVFIAALLLLAL